MAATTESAPIEVGELIVSTPGTVGGRPRLQGTRMPVQTLAAYHRFESLTAEQIPGEVFTHLTLLQVYAALAYCNANREQIEQIWDEDERFMEAFVRKYPEGRWGPDNDRGMPELDDQTA
jgi:uncharacterized protein (DUF433 family)